MPRFIGKATNYELGEEIIIPDGVPYSYSIQQGPQGRYIKVITVEEVPALPVRETSAVKLN